MKSTDIVIAGAGLMGLTSAYYLSRQGYSVRLIDSGAVGRQASWAGGGILWPLYAWRYPKPVQKMAQAGRKLYPELCAQLFSTTGIDAEYRETGMLILDTDESDNAASWCAENDEPRQIITSKDTALGVNSQCPITYLPKVAQVRNPRLCKALKAHLLSVGVDIVEHEAVKEVVEHAGQFTGMRTENETYAAKNGVICTGAWASSLLPQINVYPIKGQMLLLRGAPGALNRIILNAGRYIIPRADGHILVGSTVEKTGFKTDTDAHTAKQLKAVFDDILPAVGDLPVVQHWAGLRPATKSGVPLVGKVPSVEGLYVNAGHYRNGVVAAPASATLLRNMITKNVEFRSTSRSLNVENYALF